MNIDYTKLSPKNLLIKKGNATARRNISICVYAALTRALLEIEAGRDPEAAINEERTKAANDGARAQLDGIAIEEAMEARRRVVAC